MPEQPRTRLDEGQVRRAASALLRHIKQSTPARNKANPLLDDEGEVILAQVSLHKIPGNVSTKPIRIPIPHSLRRHDDCDMCLFVKDDAKKGLKEMMEKDPVEGLTKIIKLQKLRTQYQQFKDRRELVSQFDLFLCDERILPMMSKALGKTFLSAKKQPIPVRLSQRSSLGSQIARARDSAFLVGSHGDCWAVKLAHTAMTVDEVTANLMAGITEVVDKIPKKWKNVKAVNIKCSGSVALPIYSSLGDLPPAPPVGTSPPAQAAAPADEVTSGEQEKGETKRKMARPLIRQQLNQIKKEIQAGKNVEATPAADADTLAKVEKSGTKKLRGGDDGEEGTSATKVDKVKGKRKSTCSKTAQEGKDVVPVEMAGKRRRAAVE